MSERPLTPEALRALLDAGRHDEAAALLRTAGRLADAAEVLAQVWRFDAAVELALASERPEDAYRHALASQSAPTIATVVEHLRAQPAAARRAAGYAEQRGRIADAAALQLAAGELAAAASLYERAGLVREAAVLTERLASQGDREALRRAGILFELHLASHPEDVDAGVALGRILLGFGRAPQALAVLQRVRSILERVPDEAAEATLDPWLLRALVEAGLEGAGREVVDRLRRTRPALPLAPRDAMRALEAETSVPETAKDELVLGRYRVLRALGAGGSGRVLAAVDTFGGREVAVKVLAAQGGAQGRDALARFAREAQVAAGIDHPNVVRVFEYVPDGPLLVMELMRGGTLEDRLEQAPGGALAPPVVEHVVRSIARALEAVHRRGVVHRDLKPANVFFGAAGEVKVGDFGVAHLVDAKATLTGAMMGTLAYMAPEQITGDVAPDASTDVYALGVIAFRALTGVLPFPGPDFVAQHLGAPVPSASALAPWLPPAFDAWLARMLAKERDARPEQAGVVLAELATLPFAVADEAFARGLAQRADGGEERAQPSERPGKPSERPGKPSERPAKAPRRRADRFAPIGVDERGELAEDRWLGRRVVFVPVVDAASAERLRAWASVRSPYVQAVLALEPPTDDEPGEACLEWPTGERGVALPLPLERASELGEALDALEAAGIAHGAIDARAIVLGPSRAVLLAPVGTPVADLDEDRRAVARLFGMRG